MKPKKCLCNIYRVTILRNPLVSVDSLLVPALGEQDTLEVS